ncbi:hypothetical protein [Bacteroides sp. 519]|uniref:hypothetical protein n=1 Tax=Bacteroides sp. 519 TaxID=2302937 RepID=UPI0013D7A457|nr:hypothetical protein [Bacteroides sp. 519]NDV58371.1 hypothetical protein [Bacteroides sp. 519]
MKKLGITHRAIILFICLITLSGYSQSGDSVAKVLVDMGFENVSWIEDDEERVFVFENTPYRLNGVGVGKAIDLIQESGLPINKSCRVIVLENNVPQISLNYQPVVADSTMNVLRQDWNVTYDLGNSWKKVQKAKKENSSLYKVDIVVYPELHFRNYKLSRIYDVVFNLSPSIEISLWPGMKLAGQIVFPIVNDYGSKYEQIRPGFVTLSQTVRLPKCTFLTATMGTFNNFRGGFDVEIKHYLKDERFSIQAHLGYTRAGEYDNWAYYHDKKWTLTASLGANFYWPEYNTQFKIRGERYIREEYGVTGEMFRHFRHTSIGFYLSLVEHAGNNGLNGGFVFQIAIPPYKQKRKGYFPRVMMGDFGLKYNAGNEEVYGKKYRSRADKNDLRDNDYNPYFIKSELLNF